jgi:hypothetical protein
LCHTRPIPQASHQGTSGSSLRFAAVEDIKENADARLRTIKKEDFHQCYNNWIDRWNKCMCADGKYFEGD